MEEIFADLHVHIGRSESGKPIKITAARSLNFANIAKECADRKGINVVGIIDCASPYVIEDIENFLKTGDAYEIEDGGIIYKDKVCILLAGAVEVIPAVFIRVPGIVHSHALSIEPGPLMAVAIPVVSDAFSRIAQIKTPSAVFHAPPGSFILRGGKPGGSPIVDIAEAFDRRVVCRPCFDPHLAAVAVV